MATKTKIEWVSGGHTWNPVRGCAKVSEGCRNCYAMRQAHRFSGTGQPYEGLTHAVPRKGPQWTGEVRCVPDKLDEPLRWRKPSLVFVNSMSDLFHPDVPDEFIDRVFAVMALCPQHTFQVLTKRPERMREYMAMREPLWSGGYAVDRDWTVSRAAEAIAGSEVPLWDWPLPNVWLGVSIEDQRTADERIPLLLQTPAAVRFVSAEPLLGPVALRQSWCDYLVGWETATEAEYDAQGYPVPVPVQVQTERLNQVIVGGESGPGARPCNVAWIRSLVRQCREAKVPCFVKQLGAKPVDWCVGRLGAPEEEYDDDHCDLYEASEIRAPCSGRCHYLRSRKGNDPDEWPEDLRVREYPATEGGE